MRYRQFTDQADFQRDLRTVLDLVGKEDLRNHVDKIYRSLSQKGYTTPFDEALHSLEHDLNHLIWGRQYNVGSFRTPLLHEGRDFIIGLGQTIRALSAPARERLRRRIIGLIKNDGLRPLFNELRAAAIISRNGADIYFHDMENDGGVDFIARAGSIEWETEVKSATVFTGSPVYPRALENFRQALNRSYLGAVDDLVPLFEVSFSGRLPSESSIVQAIVDACTNVSISGVEQSLPDGVTVRLRDKIPDLREGRLDQFVHRIATEEGAGVCVTFGVPKAIVILRSSRGNRLRETISANISETAKRQCSGSRPALIFTFIDYLSREDFNKLAIDPGRTSFLDSVADAAFRSSKRDHIRQLMFAGAPELRKTRNITASDYQKRIYNAPNCRFQVPPLISGGSEQQPGDSSRRPPPRASESGIKISMDTR